jgi:hypothetical protein
MTTLHELETAVVAFALGVIAEFIRARYSSRLELRNQLRLAALPERLAAHQEAYTRWMHMMSNCNKPEIRKIATDCEDWWKGKCLYLSKEAREAFLTCCRTAFYRPDFLQEDAPRDADLIRLSTENYKTMYRTGKVIVDAVGLLPLKEEFEDIEKLTGLTPLP